MPSKDSDQPGNPSVHSDQGLLCACALAFLMWTVKTLDQTGQMPRLI